MSGYAALPLAGAIDTVPEYTLGGLDLVLASLLLVLVTGVFLRVFWRRGKSLQDV